MKKEKITDTGTNKKTTDPQEDEKDGNIFGAAFDKLAGDSKGGDSISEDEAKKEETGSKKSTGEK